MTTLNGSYREYKLDNGLHVMLQKTPTQTVSGRLKVDFGALNELAGEEGFAHFLEHILMTGGSSKYTPEQSEFVRGEFGYHNASTGLDRTIFPVDMLSGDLGLYLDFTADAVFNPHFVSVKLEEERKRVLRETSDTKSDPRFKDNQAYGTAFWGKNSPYMYFILGKEEVIRNATPEQLKAFHSRGYGAANMNLILVGDLPDNVDELIARNFADKPAGKNTLFKFPGNQNIENKIILHTRAPELYNHDQPQESSAKLKISMVAPSENHDDNCAAGILSYILGGDANSRLFKSVSQRKGLAYSIRSQHGNRNNAGGIYINGKIQSSRADEAIDAIFEEMKELQDTRVPEDELDRIKRSSIYDIAKAFETNSGHVDAIEMKSDRGITPESYLAKINAVTPELIQKAAQTYFPKDRENGKYVLMLRDPLKIE